MLQCVWPAGVSRIGEGVVDGGAVWGRQLRKEGEARKSQV